MKKNENISKYREASRLEQALSEKNLRASSLDRIKNRLEKELIVVKQFLKERDAQLQTLTQALHEKEMQIASLNDLAAASAKQVELLTRAIREKDDIIQQLQVSVSEFGHKLAQIRNSLGWKLLKPIRVATNLLFRINGQLKTDLIPFEGVQQKGVIWVATGDPIRFLLVAKRPWQRLTGWYWLELESDIDKAVTMQFYFELGDGFDSSRIISFPLCSKGKQTIPLFVPAGCRAIRLDLLDVSKIFRLTVLGLKRSKDEIQFPEAFLEQSVAYEALGGRLGNAHALMPVNAIQRQSDGNYCWRSDTDDPSFELSGLGIKLGAGWYLIDLTIRLDTDRGQAKLYFDFGNNYNEGDSVSIPFQSGQETRRIYRLIDTPKKIRFDPIETTGAFSVKRLHFTPISVSFARNHMLRYIYDNESHRRQDTSIKQLWKSLRAHTRKTGKNEEELLYARYNQSFLNSLFNSLDYTEWIERVEVPRYSHLVETIRESLQYQPTISIIMPTYNTAEGFLRRAIESVRTQSYSNWDLCIADDASPQPHVCQILEEYAQRDPRIKIVIREQNGHISRASNSALALAAGEFVALLDHDDELAQHALLFMAGAINRNPSAQILYSDEDKIDEQGNRSEPHFKPDWSPDLFFSQNYVCHLSVYRRDLLNRIGGFRTEVEGSQDYDLLLRCLPHVKPSEIIHVPKVLYHWRMLEGSTALAAKEKIYTTQAGIKALRDFFCSQGSGDITVEAGLLPNTYRVRYPIPKPTPLVSLLIPTRDMLDLLRQCVQSILENTTYPNYEIIILDNESIQSETLDYFKSIQMRHTCVRVLPYHHPFNFSAINNFGAEHARGEIVGLINNDVKVINSEWLSELVSHAVRPEIGCVGAKLYYDDDTVQHAGVIIGIGGVAGHSHKYFHRKSSGYFGRLKIIQNLSAVTAACLIVRKSVYQEVGGLDEDNLRVAFNDIDFCLKVREAGYRNLWTPYAELYHFESKSRGAENTPEKQARFKNEIEYVMNKWGEMLFRDPFYNKNLSLVREDFSIGLN
jgi:GT2 family glycosyltransferase